VAAPHPLLEKRFHDGRLSDTRFTDDCEDAATASNGALERGSKRRKFPYAANHQPTLVRSRVAGRPDGMYARYGGTIEVLDRSGESVAHPGHGYDEARAGIAERLA
jgi:hypothetical protein